MHTLRDTTLSATEGTGLAVHVGGVTATSIDSTHNIAKRYRCSSAASCCCR